MDPIAPLPEPLAGPLRLFSWGPAAWWHFALAALVAAWLWRRSRKKQPAPAPAPPPAGVPAGPAPGPVSGFGAAVRALEKLHLELGDFREGCHQLAAAVRTHLEKETGVEIEALTAAEMEKLFADTRIGRFSSELRDARFGREAPTREGFTKLCRESRRLFGAGQRYELRRRS